MLIPDRIKAFRRVPACELRPHPRNWRRHPPKQADALRGALAEIGYADALLVRELEDGGLQIIDGHLRAETTPQQMVPVLVLDLDEEEAKKLLVTLDSLTNLAQPDAQQLASLLNEIKTESGPLSEMLKELAASLGTGDDANDSLQRPEPRLDDIYQIVVEFESEDEQRRLYERLSDEGYRCRVLVL